MFFHYYILKELATSITHSNALKWRKDGEEQGPRLVPITSAVHFFFSGLAVGRLLSGFMSDSNVFRFKGRHFIDFFPRNVLRFLISSSP